MKTFEYEVTVIAELHAICYIGERPKLEMETEKSGNWAEKPGSTNLRFDTYSWQLPALKERTSVCMAREFYGTGLFYQNTAKRHKRGG